MRQIEMVGGAPAPLPPRLNVAPVAMETMHSRILVTVTRIKIAPRTGNELGREIEGSGGMGHRRALVDASGVGMDVVLAYHADDLAVEGVHQGLGRIFVTQINSIPA